LAKFKGGLMQSQNALQQANCKKSWRKWEKCQINQCFRSFSSYNNLHFCIFQCLL